MNIRPMLAASLKNENDLVNLNYPVAASPKIDGIRFMKPTNSMALSRTWKPLPNDHFQKFVMNLPELDFIDGEVIANDNPCALNLFNVTQSAIMTKCGEPEFSLWIFDNWREPEKTFEYRTSMAKQIVESLNLSNVNYVTHKLLKNVDEVLSYEEEAVTAGYEGIMLRNINAPYKYGRSTLREQGLIKIKRFIDEEAKVIGFEALERNNNEVQKDAFGLQKRSSHKANKSTDDCLGKLLVNNDKWGDFTIGSGFDDRLRNEIWFNKEKYLNQTITFKYQSYGSKDKPRIPIFKGFRQD